MSEFTVRPLTIDDIMLSEHTARADGRADIAIRQIERSDWPAVFRIIAAVVRRGDTFTYERDLDEDAARSLWIEPPPGRTVIAHDETGTVLGTAKMSRNQRGPGSHVATASVMVAPDARGRGVGRLLGEYALKWARGAGFRSMQFNAVVAANAPAVHLWRSLGFSVVGTVPEAFLHPERGYVDLLVMHRRLAGGSA